MALSRKSPRIRRLVWIQFETGGQQQPRRNDEVMCGGAKLPLAAFRTSTARWSQRCRVAPSGKLAVAHA